MAEAARTASLDDQIPLYNEAQETVISDAPVMPVLFGARFILIRPWVQNLTLTSLDGIGGELSFA